MDPYTEHIAAAFKEAGLGPLSNRATEQFASYLELLQRWSSRVSLTAITDPAEIVRRHLVESAFAAKRIPAGTETLMDYGSGGGFPGIPIAILRPELRVTLLEAHGKKATFLSEVVRTTGIGAKVLAVRAETLPSRHAADVVTMRAVEKMDRAIPIAAELTRKHLILMATEQSAQRFQCLAPGFKWGAPCVLPNSHQMLLLIGSRE